MTQKARGPKCPASSHLCKLCKCGRHRLHCSCTKPWGWVPSHLESCPPIRESTTAHRQNPFFPGRRPCRLDYPFPNSTVLNPTWQERLALQTQPENSEPGVQGEQQQGVALQNWEAQEIVPEDIKYRLEPPPKALYPKKPPNCFSQYFKPQWFPFGTTCGECFKSWKMEPETCYGEKPSHLSPPLGQSMFPVHIQRRKVTPIGHRGYVESLSQYQSDFQGPLWRRVITPDPDQISQGINKYIQRVQKETAPGRQPTTCQHQEPSRLKQVVTILGEDSTAQMPYLLPPKALVKAVKGKCPSSTPGVFKAKFQTETTSKQFLQDWGAQSQLRYGDSHFRGHQKPLAPSEDPTITRVSYMPLFSERVKLCKPKINSIKSEASTISLSTGNLSGQSSCLKAGSRSTCANNST